ncbi:GPW/gp25 family protein [Shimia sp. Alg240-R146]|uniref:GPW/gp25 family protein n=1 Tax=Shimia sp. Alg240-R146 TaxID=2993449 RepID=UPI0022E0A9AB|nr:GPW/gp25 family protein [Shimia sp. Alg240-R146]
MSQLNTLSFPFSIDPGSARAREESDYDAYIKQLIRQVLLTDQGERINRPTFGSSLRAMLFNGASGSAATYSKALVYQALTRWLANFIKVANVEARAEDATLFVEVHYSVIATGERRFLNVELAS